MRSLRCRASVSMLVLLVLLTTLPGQRKDPNIADTEPLSPQEEVKKFHLPPGFEIQLVAAEPDIHKPINIDFDDRGRLWVTETVEYPFAAPPGRKPRDAVKILDGLRPRRPGPQDHHLRRRAEHPHRRAAAARQAAPATLRLQHPEHLPPHAIPTATARPTSAKRSTPSSASATRTA